MVMEKKEFWKDEIDLGLLVRILISKWKLIAGVTLLFMAFGVLIAFTSRVEYVASCKLMIEDQKTGSSSLGRFGGLAGLAGINLDAGSSGTIPSALFPEIVYSLPFQQKIMHDSILFESKGIRCTPYYYFLEVNKPTLIENVKRYTIGLPGILRSKISKSDIENDAQVGNNNQAQEVSGYVKIDKIEWDLIQGMRNRITTFVDFESGIVWVSAKMPDAVAASELTHHVVEILTDEVTQYKTEKAQQNLEFIEASYQQAKTSFEESQLRLATFADRNRNINTQQGRIEIQRLQHEYDLAFEMFKNLASQVEQSKIKLKEETPVFKVLEPVRVPLEKTEPKRKIILLASVALGIFLSVSYFIVKNFKKIRNVEQ